MWETRGTEVGMQQTGATFFGDSDKAQDAP